MISSVYFIPNPFKTSSHDVCKQVNHTCKKVYVEKCWQKNVTFLLEIVCYSTELTMSMSIFQLLMLLFVWKPFFGNPLHQPFFLIHTKYASIRSSCRYEDVNYPFKDDLYKLWNYPKLCHKGPCVKPFTKVHQFDLPVVLTDTENLTSHYVGLSQNTKT